MLPSMTLLAGLENIPVARKGVKREGPRHLLHAHFLHINIEEKLLLEAKMKFPGRWNFAEFSKKGSHSRVI